DSLTEPFTVVDMAGSGLRAWIGPTPVGGAETPDQLALNAALTWSAANKWFTGDLSLANTDVDAYLLSLGSKAATLELTETATNRVTLLQVPVTLTSAGDEGSSTSPAPADSYYTKAEVLALLAKLINDPGVRIVLKSANGVYGRELGVNDDGSPMDNFIT